jgi:hypothetical protein
MKNLVAIIESVAAVLVVVTAMIDPRISVGLAAVCLALLAIHEVRRSRARHE